jgi:hypothetical protein
MSNHLAAIHSSLTTKSTHVAATQGDIDAVLRYSATIPLRVATIWDHLAASWGPLDATIPPWTRSSLDLAAFFGNGGEDWRENAAR